MEKPRIVSQEEWTVERKTLLAKEKELTRHRDQVNAERRQLPWVKVTKEYVFDTMDGKKTLSDLFDGRSQMIVGHFMFSPDWNAGCVGCSFGNDHVDAAYMLLDTTPKGRNETHAMSWVRRQDEYGDGARRVEAA